MANFLRRALLVSTLTIGFFSLKAQNVFWQDVKESSFTVGDNQTRTVKPNTFRAFTVDTSSLKSLLQSAPKEFTDAAKSSPLIFSVPMPDGTSSKFSVVYSPIMEPALAAQFPNIRTYSGQGIDDKTATLKMDWTDFGLHIQVLSPTNNEAFYVDPYVQGGKTQYISYRKRDLPVPASYVEQGVIKEEMNSLNGLGQRTTAGICLGTQLRTYRLAVACTGEYAVAVGATTIAQALSAVTTTVNRVDGIYETELSVRLTLVGNESTILYTDAASDPFTGNNNANTLITESQTVITNIIGTANYDIGHTFSTGAGGLAGLGVVCNSSQKARGVTGSTSPLGDAYDVDYVAHEMGHEFGGNHTFNAVTSNCGGGNRNAATSVEPGSGITIMAYAGICGATNDLASHSIAYFHATSENEIGNYITFGTGSTCGTITSTGNSIPVVNAGSNYTIPAGTPFKLTGSATDANNSEVLTFSWEEIDPGTTGDNWNSGSKPYFRSFSPTLSPSRYFPQLSDILNNTTTIGEILPTTSQTLNFRLTARDNRVSGSGVCSADMQVTVNSGAGPFQVTSQWGNDVWTANGSNTALITWSVASTNLAPINTANVSILFSADGGQTFPYTLLASTANDGSETIIIPSIKTSKGRIMVKAVGNVFFNINSSVITVNTSCAAEGAVVAPATTVTALHGSSTLNLGLSPQYSSTFAPSGQIISSDPTTSLSLYDNSTSTCGGPYCNIYKYKTYTFIVTQTGNYTFNRTGAGSVFGIYTSFDPAAMCNNLVKNNYSAGTVASAVAPLTAGITYTLVIGVNTASASGTGGCTDQAFNTSAANTLPFSFSLAIVPPSGGAAYGGSGIYANPGAGFNYTYVVVNNATGNVVSIGSSDLSNANNYPAGQYTVYGFSYSSTIANLNSYVGGSLTNLLNQVVNNTGSFCADLSKNSVTVNVTGVLPVQLTALKARKQGEKVSLDWGTLTEQNSSHFIVQRSANASEFGNEIGNVKAAGNSTSELKYNFLDVNPIKGWNYYRIKQVDIDSRFTYSNVAAVNFEKGGGLMVIYPNPAKDQLNVEYTSERSGNLQLQVIDSKGSVLMAEKMNITTGRNSRSLNISFLSTGMYLLKYIDGDGNISFSKFVKQ
jgi:hypothetical protein